MADFKADSNPDKYSGVKTEVTFESLGLCPELRTVCKKIGWSSPTQIQKGAIPPGLQGKDVIGLAETGSGKTGAFGLPILQALLSKDVKKKPFALILAPTRELVYQIKEQMDKLGGHMGIRSVAIVGGVPKDNQIEQLLSHPHIIVATPGRLLDLLEKIKKFSIDTIQYLVLDEADRILGLDFEKELNKILKYVPEQRKTLLFSATMTKKVNNLLTKAAMKDPVRVEVSKEYQTSPTLKEYMLLCPLLQKFIYLAFVLKDIGKEKSVMIFCSKKQETMQTAMILRNIGIWALPLHGQFTQQIRLNILNKFKAGTHKVLVSTDLAARGLDLPNVDYVFNFDTPLSSKNYVHRVGRTARAGKNGTSITFVTQYEVQSFLKIEEALQCKMEPYPAPEEEVMKWEQNIGCAARLAEKQMKGLEKEENTFYKKRKMKVEEDSFSKKLSELRTAQKKHKRKKNH